MKRPEVLHEDNHLLVVRKPSGIPTHTPDPRLYWGWREYEMWRHPERGELAVLHRLDRETSGVLVFGKSPEAARELTRQWERGEVQKRYLLLTRSSPRSAQWVDRRPIEGQEAVTEFRALGKKGNFHCVEALPKTGRTHQVRLHAAWSGIPVVGDREHADARDEWPLLLHAAEIGFRHPGGGAVARYSAEVPDVFSARSAAQAWWRRASLLREFLESGGDARRWIHSDADGFPRQAVEKFGNVWVVYRYGDVPAGPLEELLPGGPRVVKKFLGQGRVQIAGSAPAPGVVQENGLRFEVRFDEATTTGLFLDQRENRLWLRRMLTTAPEGPVLNCFAHTASFSTAAAAEGRLTASIDLSARYLDWGKRNFRLNGLDPDAGHRWLKGDAGGWMKRLRKRGEKFAVVVLDPPSFSRSKSGDFRVEKHLEPMVAEAARLIVPGGSLLVATNFQTWSQEAFLARVGRALKGRPVSYHFIPMSPDFPHHPGSPLWMKSVWVTVGG